MSTPTQMSLDAWVKGFPRQEALDRLAELEAEAAGLREALALYDKLVKPEGDSATPTPGTWTPPNRPEAIRQVFRDRRNSPAGAGEVKDIMLANGWLADTAGALKLFYSALSTMTKRGHLLRLQDGRYMLPPDKLGAGTMS